MNREEQKKLAAKMRPDYPKGTYNLGFVAPAAHRINLDMFERVFDQITGWECSGGGDSGVQYEHPQLGVEINFYTQQLDGIPTHIEVEVARLPEGRSRNREQAEPIPANASEDELHGRIAWLVLSLIDEKLKSVKWLVDYRKKITDSTPPPRPYDPSEARHQ